MNLFRHINRDEIMFDFLVFNNDKDGYYDEAIELGAKIYYLPPRKNGLKQYHRNLDGFFKKHAGNYIGIHKHDMSLSSIAPLYYAKKYGIPQRIMHMHGSNCHGIHNKLLHLVNKHRLSHIVTDSLGCSKQANLWGYSSTPLYKKSKVITNGIDIKKFAFNQAKRDKFRASLGITENDLILLHVGSFNEIKNQKFLLEILSEILKEKKTTKLLLAGIGPLLEDIRQQAQLKGLGDSVIFLGQQEDVPGLMSAADMLVFPSLHEGLPFVLVEAQASGLPVVSSTGIPMEAKVSHDFYFIDLERGAKYWSQEILKIAGSLSGREIDSKSSISNYSIQNTVKQIEMIYKA